MSHCTPIPTRCSVAPYNFVPLSEKVSKVAADDLPDHDSYQAKTFSGWFDVTLETKTPLYIRCPLTESEAQRKEAAQKQKRKLDFPDFYYTESKNKPVIPGSSLRGMLRNLVEIISQSKMGDVSDVPFFLGHTRMMRLPYKKSPFKLLPEEHREQDSIDLAEAMFGFCGKNKNQGNQGEKSVAYRHRISVSDAALGSGQTDIWYSTHPVVPKILSSPKPTTFQHYLVQPDEDVNNLHHYDSEGAELRGHKLYWHKSANDFVETDQAKLKKSASQYTKIKPVRKGVHFQFKVHFDNLSEEELVYLCLAMQPCSSNSKEYCHKLGIGKPLGLGTVKLTPEMWIVNRRTRYGTFGEIGARKFPLPQSEENGTFASKPRIRELLAMMHFPGEVPDAHKVYLDQHSVAGGSNIKVFKDRRVLPKPTDVKVSSPK